MNNLALLTISLLLLVSCSSKAQSTSKLQLKALEGQFYLVSKSGKNFLLEENCWIEDFESVLISPLDEGGYTHTLTFNGHHAYNYAVSESESNDDTLLLSGVDVNYIGEETEQFQFKIWKETETVFGILDVNHNSRSYFSGMENMNLLKIIPCEDEVESVSDESDQLKEEILQMLDPFFTGEEIPFDRFIMDSVEFQYPGPGLYSMNEYGKNLRFILDNSYYKGFIDMCEDGIWAELPINIVNKLPFICDMENEVPGIFVHKDGGRITLHIFTGKGDKSNYKLIINGVLKESGELIVDKITLDDCSA